MSKSNVLITGFLLLMLAACNNSTNDYKLVWQDEFNYVGLPDSSKWAYDQEGNAHGWGNQESQFYTKARQENTWVDDGKLHITAIHEPFEDKEFTSARLMSKADWQHGKVEVRARLPKGVGTWSAIWMMPGGWTFNDGNWPNIGEIDIMEHVGYDLGVIHASAHSKDYQWQTGTQQTATLKVPDVDTQFHNYILEWTPDTMKAFVDNQQYFVYGNEGLGVDKWPYEKPFYLLLNVAVGGAWGSVNGIDTLAFPQTMEIDYVRIYQK